MIAGDRARPNSGALLDDIQQGSKTQAGNLPVGSIMSDELTCALSDLPPGAWLLAYGGRWRLPLPTCPRTERTLICLALTGTVCPEDVSLGADLTGFLRGIVRLQAAQYPVELRGKTARWDWPEDHDGDELLHGAALDEADAKVFLIGKLRAWARQRLLEGGAR